MINKLIVYVIKGLFVCALMLVLGTLATCGTFLVHINDANGGYMIVGVVVVFFLMALVKW